MNKLKVTEVGEGTYQCIDYPQFWLCDQLGEILYSVDGTNSEPEEFTEFENLLKSLGIPYRNDDNFPWWRIVFEPIYLDIVKAQPTPI